MSLDLGLIPSANQPSKIMKQNNNEQNCVQIIKINLKTFKYLCERKQDNLNSSYL